MKTLLVASAAFALGAAVLTPAGANAAPPTVPATPASATGEPDLSPGLVVKFEPNAVVALAEGDTLPGPVARELELTAGAPVGLGWIEAKLPEPVSTETAQEYADRLTAEPAIASAEPQLIMQPMAPVPQPDDPLWLQQWGFSSYGDDTFENPETKLPLDAQVTGTNLREALGAPRGDTPVVAVIDTGITNHPDLGGRLVPGYNFISSPERAGNSFGRGPDASDPGDWVTPTQATSLPFATFGCASPRDSTWHGTHVTGTLAAVTDNDLGVAGTVPAQIQTLRALGRCGGTSGDIAAAMLWAAGGSVPGVPDNPTPARIVNMSLGGGGACPQHYQEVIDYGRSKGTVYVVAAGNSNSNAAIATPANCEGVITVAATSAYGGRADFSNYGDLVDIAAPGAAIMSTLNTGLTTPVAPTYVSYDGTSMATPHVAGALAMLVAAEPTLTPAQLEARLLASATPFKQISEVGGSPSFDCVGDDPCGVGYLNTAALLGQPTDAAPVVAPRFQVRAVANGQVTPANGQVDVAVAYQPGRDDVDDYVVEVRRNGVLADQSITTATSVDFTVAGALGDDYEVTVQPRKAAVGGVISQAMEVPSLAPSVPDPPRITSVSAADTVASVSVQNTFATPEPTVTVVTATPGGASCEVTELPSAGGCLLDGLTPGVEYTFTAVSSNSVGDSAPSEPVVVTPQQFAAPTAPGAPTVVMQGTTANLTWTASTPAQGRSIASYVALDQNGESSLSRCTVVSLAGPPITSCQVANLVVGETYTFTVTATDDTGKTSQSQPSAPVQVAGTATPPSAPSLPPTIEVGDGSVTASLEGDAFSFFNGGSEMIAMRVIASPGGASCDIPWNAPGSPACVITGLTNGQRYTFTSVGVNGVGVSAPSNQSMPFTPGVPLPPGAEYATLDAPIRVFDSRQQGGPIPSDVPQVVDVQAPADAVAVAYNVTVTGTTSGGHAVVGPAGVALPTSSTINWFAANQTFANGYVSALGDSGEVQLIVRGGTAQLILDVVGYYVAAPPAAAARVATAEAGDAPAVFVPLDPSTRAFDSRTSGGPLPYGQSRNVDLAAAVPTGAGAVAYTLTAFDTVGSGHLSVGLPGQPKPPTSTINWFASGQRLANSTVATLDDARQLTVFGGGTSTNFTVDVLGYFIDPSLAPNGLRFTPITPARAYDSRDLGAGGPLVAGQRRVTATAPLGESTPAGARAMAYNLTIADTTGASHLRVAGGDTAAPPPTSVINWYTDGMRLANGSVTAIDDGAMTTFAGGGSTQYIVDIAGYYH